MDRRQSLKWLGGLSAFVHVASLAVILLNKTILLFDSSFSRASPVNMILAEHAVLRAFCGAAAWRNCWTIGKNMSKISNMTRQKDPKMQEAITIARSGAKPPQSVPETIAEAIAKDIAAERLAPGQRLIELQIAQELGASRGSVRDALRLLEKRGLIEIYPNRGAVVVGLSLEDAADNNALSSILIGLASRYVAEQQQPEVLARVVHLRKQVDDMIARGFSPPMEFATATGRFFAAMVTACGNRPLREAMSGLLHRISWEAMWDAPGDMLTIERQQEAAEILGRVADCVAMGDAEGADQNARHFNQRQRDCLLTELARRRGRASTALGRATMR